MWTLKYISNKLLSKPQNMYSIIYLYKQKIKQTLCVERRVGAEKEPQDIYHTINGDSLSNMALEWVGASAFWLYSPKFWNIYFLFTMEFITFVFK